ncbi:MULTISPECIES: trigger factor [Thermoanaerobacterium]|uniref:Trigger factor n=1 Tax=Thermoanaerobacterium xylanolyticum (strain ATCC 49914 / DSM 7097 / LX-11) TaxID=858215 RepID=F6BIW9_THEXL|nr:trigger factor [Thermoanaerobacterium xylanolyticum]AEF17854.1 Trigger factor [Thermoanaerobacterium xylanolyticum LX-11]
MSSNLKKIENSVATIELNIPKEKFEEGLNFSYKKNVGRFNIPGFRRGKAPRIIIERYYGEGVLYEDAIEHVFPDAYQEAIDTLKLEPIDNPTIDILQIGKGQDLIIEAVVPVLPDVELGQYKGIEVKKVEYNVKDEDINNRLEQMRQSNARVVPVEDRAAQMGDIVDISFEGFLDGVPFEGGKSDNYSLELGSKTFIPGFEEQIVGHNVNEEFDVNVKFPDDYRAEELKGKDVVFKVKIFSIKHKELPELNDDFAKDVSEFDTLDELKEDIKRELQEQYDLSAKEEMKENVVKAVVENSKVDIPEIMVDRQIDISLRDLDYNLRYQGLDLDKYLEITGKTEEDLRKEMHDDAALRVKTQLVIDKIGKIENITATDEEVDKRLSEMATNYNVKLEDLKKELTESQINNIKDDIVYFKTIDFIFENSKIIDKEE